ncbi:DUF2732 family protein [Buttiauxella sp. A111]|uniref:DUF2732 family protein n=1 Tax=Buttiauxella sp. A111 TaxID=2563088 RepID=UPI0010E1A20F|nr:DUF2732 family protein [Buttiauxella sp. A111]GDX05748.1 DUF2732 family protein [Buttiauxella sp. A111]
MKMVRQDIPTAHGVGLPQLLKQATNDGKKAAADLCSTRLDKLATHAANYGLSANEIIELIRQESESLSSKGGAAWQ